MASSEENQISDGSNQPPLNQCKIWIESFASGARKKLLSLLEFVWEKLLPSLVWVGAVLITIWIYGYIACNFSGIADELVKILLTSLITLVFLGILILIVWKSDPERRPSRFIVLGIVITVIAMLVQSFSGELVCSRCLVWGDPDAVVSCRLRVAEFWFGNKGFIWGIATALFGAAWNFWEQYKRDQEEQQRFLERIRQFSLSADQNPEQIQLAREWDQLREYLRSKKIQSDMKQGLGNELERIRKQNMEKWTHMILSWIDWQLAYSRVKALSLGKTPTIEKFFDNEIIQKLLRLLIRINTPLSNDAKSNENQNNKAENDNNKNRHWSTIITFTNKRESGKERNKSQLERSGKLKEGPEEILDAILWMWREYDVLAREWVVLLIEKLITDFPLIEKEKSATKEKIKESIGKEKASTKEKIKESIKNLHNSRRLTRHTQIRSLFPDLYTSPMYNFLSPWPDRPPNLLSENVQRWLEGRRNPFGMARAEWEDETVVYYPDDWDLIENMTKDVMLWVTAPPGSGRTKLARTTYFDLTQLKKNVFPIYMILDIPIDAAITRYLLEQLLHHLVEMWGGIIMRRIDQNGTRQAHPFNGPTAFLDMDYHAQHKVAQLFFWEMGSLEAIWARLATLGVDLTGTIEGKALKARLEFLLRDPPPQTLPERWMMDLASARPVGLSSTFVLLELNNDISKDQAFRLITLAEMLQQEKVYLKIFTSLQPPAVCLQAELSWTKKYLRIMLDERDIDGIMNDEAKEALTEFIHANANSSPREMMRLGKMALELRAKRDAERPDDLFTPPTEENVLTENDIKEATIKHTRFFKSIGLE